MNDQPKDRPKSGGSKPQMRIEEVKITPQQARDWLAIPSPRPTRTLRQRNVRKIMHAIENGDWKVTWQAIALAPEGWVIDGRHRLTAIGGQRKHVTSLVAFDADPDTYAVADTGASRSPGDVLKVAGFTDVNVLSAATRQVIAYPFIVGTASTLGSITNEMTNADVLTALEDPEIGKTIEQMVRPGNNAANLIGRYGMRTSMTVLMAVVALYTSHGVDTQEEFFARLADGAHLGTESPIYTFRRWITSDSSSNSYYAISGSYRPTAFLSVGIRCWNDYVTGQDRHSIRWKEHRETMPEVT